MIILTISGAALAFWACAPLMVLGAIGVVVFKKPVHAALSLVLFMICLAIQYAAQDAPFLFVVQIIVYTGAVMMLFLFVVMMLGTEAKTSLVETIKGHRISSIVCLVLFGILLVFGVSQLVTNQVVGLNGIRENGNVEGIAGLLFTKYVFAFEATSALLITAVIAAMVLAHGERTREKLTQVDAANLRIKAYAEDGAHPGPLPGAGVYAQDNKISNTALLPDGTVATSSISETLEQRGVVVDGEQFRDATSEAFKRITKGLDDSKGVQE